MRTNAVYALPLALALLAAGVVAPSPVAAQQPAQTTATLNQRTLRVSGTGEVQVAPDQATLDFAVESTAATANAAGQENATRMDRVIRALVAAGIPRTSIQTRNYSVGMDYGPPQQPNGEPQVRGYRASNTVTLTTGDIGRVGALLDVALRAGANRVDGVSFGLKDPEAARNQALRRAVESARRSAEAMAAALGIQMGSLLDASTVGDLPRPVPVMMRADARAASAETPIQPGEQTVTATASLVYAIVS